MKLKIHSPLGEQQGKRIIATTQRAKIQKAKNNCKTKANNPNKFVNNPKVCKQPKQHCKQQITKF